MNRENLKIWCNNPFSPTQKKDRDFLIKAVGENRLMLFEPAENGRRGESADFLRQADVAFGTPDAEAVVRAENLSWVHLNSAGYAAFDNDAVRAHLSNKKAILTNSSTVYSEPCAQHLSAMILSLARSLPAALDIQRTSRTWETRYLRARARTLNEQIGLIFGFGTIGRRLAELLAPFGIKMIGVRRKISGDESIRVITNDSADEFLPRADHVVNILPENPETKGFFDAARLSRLKSTACFYNIGRGATVELDALRTLLENGKIAAAYLDVTSPEPLPPDDPLWRTKNCYITPHVAGGANDEKQRQVGHFLENLRRFTSGEPLLDRIV
ncbi:MAG TPA: D-2-hydroxyacid dehydrogenase [Pyrinomonadaceae bacterium]|jgi:phosphoglycerate dehydrogenase-like enzyme